MRPGKTCGTGREDGQTLPLIGKLLGHKKSATTERYAHLADDPIRAANEEVAQLLGKAFKSSAAR